MGSAPRLLRFTAMPLTPTETRNVLTQLGHRPNRQLGQNFLIDGNIVRKSLELAQVAAGDAVIEIGPGLGTLTDALLGQGAEVWAVEFDPRLHAHLATSVVPQAEGRLHLMHGDAVEHPLAGFADANRAFKIVANLPYSISTPWLDAVLEGRLPDRLVLMVQREAADRFLASPGGKDFGAISIFLQSAFEAAPGHKVSRGCFHPVPDVDSYLLHLVRRGDPFRFSAPAKQVIRACFQQRRKQLGALLRRHAPDAAEAAIARLATAGFTAQSRPEEVTVAAWQSLAPLLAPAPAGN